MLYQTFRSLHARPTRYGSGRGVAPRRFEGCGKYTSGRRSGSILHFSSESPIPIGTVGYGSNCKFLSEVADATGGRSFVFESHPELAQVLKKTLDDLRSQ